MACLFREPQHDPRLVERIKVDTGRSAGTLDPLGATIAPGNRFYERLLSGLAEAVESCLSKVR